MKQVMQDLAKGETMLIEAPSPQISAGHVNIYSTISLISVGTERMLLDFGKASLLTKARQQPDKVKMVLDKIKTDGLFATTDAVLTKLAQPIPLGYCNVGVVTEVGADVSGIKPGDRVVSNGPHAEIVKVPQNLCVRIPDEIEDEIAAFTIPSSIALQGIRLANPTLGEAFVVTGVGLIGLLTVQLLRANGCRVLAIDYDEKRLALARDYGADICNPGKGEDPVKTGLRFSDDNGVDAVIITAASKSNEPVSTAAKMSRKRGRIVLVGVTGLDLNRADFYEKELTFQVSCSYGPGRYDENYEKKGNDYPYGFVRWTERRNFEAVLDIMTSGQLNLKPLITHRFEFEEIKKAYNMLSEGGDALGVLLKYGSEESVRNIKNISLNSVTTFDKQKPIVGFVGAGNYASRVLIPAFNEADAQLHTLISNGGTSSAIHGKKSGFIRASSDVETILNDESINTIVVATRHNTHAQLVVQSLKAGKNVFVEKPLAIKQSDLDEILSVYETVQADGNSASLMVGFNRRFAPLVQKMKELLSTVKEPKSLVMTVNAGAIPANHWTQDLKIGGGRIIGEVCHFIDLIRFLVGKPISSWQRHTMDSISNDTLSINLSFTDGSIGTVHYFANGSKLFPKERLEVFVSDRVLQLDNFRKLTGYGWPGFKKMRLWRQDKGQNSCVVAFLDAISKGTESPIPFDELLEVSQACIEISEQH